jgi:O-acetyl-ADP-ribose deacetylase (regulator of RNase III)
MEDVRRRISVVTGDIAALGVGAIVAAAGPGLRSGAGVFGAIERAAGPRRREACRASDGCPPGEARRTGGYELPARWVIHAVGPGWRGGREGEPAVLAGAYTEALRLAKRNEIASLAFPPIATGGCGFPRDEAARVAVRSVAAWLVTCEWPRHVTFCSTRSSTADRYRELLANLDRQR